jgi:tricorn protease
MKSLFSLCLMLAIVPAFAQDSPYFASYPALSPDGKAIVFSYEGDLWKSDIGQKTTVRLTAMQGDETNAKISPDGKWLAFSSNQFGNNDIYLMPFAGG